MQRCKRLLISGLAASEKGLEHDEINQIRWHISLFFCSNYSLLLSGLRSEPFRERFKSGGFSFK